MLRSRILIAFFVLTAVLFTAGWQVTSEPSRLDDAGLKTMLTGLGYEVKEINPTTFEVPISAADLKIPTRVFLSKSKTKIWLSVALMTDTGTAKLAREDLLAILEKNVDIGPCHFMIEKGWLKMKMALDNRSVTPVVLRSEIDYLSARVVESKGLWQKP